MDFNLPYGNWVDLAVGILIVVGIVRGRKRGMSEELLDVLKWGLIVFAAGWLYLPAGQMLAQSSFFSVLFCFVGMYVAIALLIFGVFAFIRRQVGEKLLVSDTFGNAEYYLGMVAGGFRYFCVLIVVFALLNARQYTAEEIARDRAFQEQNFGFTMIPNVGTLQREVFAKSLTGHFAQRYLRAFLIQPTLPETKGLGNWGAVQARDRNVNEVLDRR